MGPRPDGYRLSNRTHRLCSISIITLVTFLIAPSKAAAIAYALLMGILLLTVLVGIGGAAAIIRLLSNLRKSFRH